MKRGKPDTITLRLKNGNAKDAPKIVLTVPRELSLMKTKWYAWNATLNSKSARRIRPNVYKEKSVKKAMNICTLSLMALRVVWNAPPIARSAS